MINISHSLAGVGAACGEEEEEEEGEVSLSPCPGARAVSRSRAVVCVPALPTWLCWAVLQPVEMRSSAAGKGQQRGADALHHFSAAAAAAAGRDLCPALALLGSGRESSSDYGLRAALWHHGGRDRNPVRLQASLCCCLAVGSGGSVGSVAVGDVWRHGGDSGMSLLGFNPLRLLQEIVLCQF